MSIKRYGAEKSGAGGPEICPSLEPLKLTAGFMSPARCR